MSAVSGAMTPTVLFDGKQFAGKKTEELKLRFAKVSARLGRIPRLVTIVSPENEAGLKYAQLKMKKAQEVGVDNKIDLVDTLILDELKEKILKYNADDSLDGLMVQMPLGSRDDQVLIKLIDLNKDIDGMREDSPYVPAVVRAVLEILAESGKTGSTVIVGSQGAVGAKLMKYLDTRYRVFGMDKEDFDTAILKQADIVISATGQADLITPEIVKEGVVAIDVGYPGGDFAPAVAGKAAFFTPVPGGVGPVTVISLFANLADALDRRVGPR